MANKEKTYIYESPDNGKTVYRREFMNYEKRELIKTGNWCDPTPEKKDVSLSRDALVEYWVQKYPNDYDIGRAVRKYYIENIYKK